MLTLSKPNNDAASNMSASPESEMRGHERQGQANQAEDGNGAKIGQRLGGESGGGLDESGHFSIPHVGLKWLP